MEMTMGKIKREDLLSLEAYYKARPEMRLKAIAERKKRTVILGEHLNMIFENKYLMQYQIQEMCTEFLQIDNFRPKLQIKVANKGQSCRSANKRVYRPENLFATFAHPWL